MWDYFLKWRMKNRLMMGIEMMVIIGVHSNLWKMYVFWDVVHWWNKIMNVVQMYEMNEQQFETLKNKLMKKYL